MKQLLLFVCFLWATLSHAQTKTWYVSPTGDDANSGTQASPWKTIRAAVPKMDSGDTLVALAGNYVSTTATDITFWDIKNSTTGSPLIHTGGGVVINKVVNIKGAGADVTIFGKFGGSGSSSANNGGQFFEVQNGGSLTLMNLTLQDAGYDTNGTGAPTRGGAIMVAASTTGTTVGTGNLKLIRCNLLKNTAKVAGAIAFISSGTFTMEGCYLDGNKQFGGANTLGCAGIEIKGGTSTITNCIFIAHNAQVSTAGATLGSVIHASEGTVSLIHNTFAKTIMNVAQTGTGTVRIINTARADKIINNLFYDNTFMDFWAASTANIPSTAVVKGNVMATHTNLPSPTTDNNVNAANTGASAAIAANTTKTVASITKVTFVTNTGTAVVGKGVVDASVPTLDIQGIARNTAAPAVGATDVSPNVLPTVSITSPANNTSLQVPATLALKATASDTDGTITKVEFFNGSTLLGLAQLTSGSYDLTLTSLPAGTYTITALATDNSGGTRTSAAITVEIKGANVKPTVNIVDPADQTLLIGPITSVILMATATDTDGTISKVEFFDGTTKLGDATLANGSYSFVWANPALGTYTITAKATDNDGGSTSSTVVTLFIKDAITSTESELRNAGLQVVPTASYNGFTITSDKKIISAVRAYNRMGRIHTQVYPKSTRVQVIGENWTPGLYVIQIELKSGETLVKKVIK